MTKRVPMYAVLIICLSTPLLIAGQNKDSYPANREKAAQIGAKVERAIKLKEPKWRLKGSSEGAASYQRDGVWEMEVNCHQRWASGAGKFALTIFVYDSNEEASRNQKQRREFSSVAASRKLDGFEDEAYYINHRYFSWVGVRRGRVLIEVHGSGLALTVTRRFAQHALEQIEDQ